MYTYLCIYELWYIYIYTYIIACMQINISNTHNSYLSHLENKHHPRASPSSSSPHLLLPFLRRGRPWHREAGRHPLDQGGLGHQRGRRRARERQELMVHRLGRAERGERIGG